MKKQELEITPLNFGNASNGYHDGMHSKYGTTKIRIRLSVPLLKYLESNLKANETKSRQIERLLIEGLRERK